jgi:hypothetical protein
MRAWLFLVFLQPAKAGDLTRDSADWGLPPARRRRQPISGLGRYNRCPMTMSSLPVQHAVSLRALNTFGIDARPTPTCPSMLWKPCGTAPMRA